MGIKIQDASGRLIVDMTTRLSKYLGSVSISAPGSLAVTVPAGNQLWAQLLLDRTYSMSSGNYPSLSISGNTLSWTYASASNRVGGTIIYGAY